MPKTKLADGKSLDKMKRQMEYNKKWQEKNNLTRMTLRLPAETRDVLEFHAKSRNESLTSFIIRSCMEQMERDTAAKSLDLDKLLAE